MIQKQFLKIISHLSSLELFGAATDWFTITKPTFKWINETNGILRRFYKTRLLFFLWKILNLNYFLLFIILSSRSSSKEEYPMPVKALKKYCRLDHDKKFSNFKRFLKKCSSIQRIFKRRWTIEMCICFCILWLSKKSNRAHNFMLIKSYGFDLRCFITKCQQIIIQIVIDLFI